MKERFLWCPTMVNKGYKRGIAWLDTVYEVEGKLYTSFGLNIRDQIRAMRMQCELMRDEIKNDPYRKYAVYQLPFSDFSISNSIVWHINTSTDKYTGAKNHYLFVTFNCGAKVFKFKKTIPLSDITKSLMYGTLTIGGRDTAKFKLWLVKSLAKNGFKVIERDL